MMTHQNHPTQNESLDKQTQDQPAEDSPKDLTDYPKTTIRIGLGIALLGFVLFLLGARPSLFGLDRSRVIGFVQISVFLFGLALITFGSYLTLNAFWQNGNKTIAADIGSRLISTGYVICVFTAMADIFGLGSHRLPDVFFGPLQARGMSIGMGTIALGFLLLIRYKRPKRKRKSPKTSEKPDRTPPENSTKLDLRESSPA
ncbi:MAG: hypothetical protein ACOCYU_08530 [Brevefilum sp.]